MSAPFVVSIIGRPNVGKSSIFNRLLGKPSEVLSYDRPGVTRDRHYALANLGTDEEPEDIVLIDTGGFYPEEKNLNDPLAPPSQTDVFFNLMADHALLAIEESDLILFVTDVKEGLIPFDHGIVDIIRSKQKDFLLLVNKCDNEEAEAGSFEFFSLGLEDDQIKAVSAAHSRGINDLLSCIQQKRKEFLKEKESRLVQKGVMPDFPVVGKLSIIGAPNAGKSTLLNQLVGAERALVSEIPGTTVDPIEAYLTVDFKGAINDLSEEEECDLPEGEESEAAPVETRYSLAIVDTAGIRKGSNIKDELESLMVYRSLRALSGSDIVILMVDVAKGVTHQDRRLCEIALDRGKSLILCLNKIDTATEFLKTKKEMREYLEGVRIDVPWLSFCDIIPLSAKRGDGTARLLKSVVRTVLVRRTKISTGKLNRFIDVVTEKHPIVIGGIKASPLKIKYASMVKSSPPTFLLFSNRSKKIPTHYRRYLVNQIRKEFKLYNTPVHLVFRVQR